MDLLLIKLCRWHQSGEKLANTWVQAIQKDVDRLFRMMNDPCEIQGQMQSLALGKENPLAPVQADPVWLVAALWRNKWAARWAWASSALAPKKAKRYCAGAEPETKGWLFPSSLHLLNHCQALNTGEALTISGSSSAGAPLWWGLEHWPHKEMLEEWDCSAWARMASGDQTAPGANREVTEQEPGSSQQWRTGRWEAAGIFWKNKS